MALRKKLPTNHTIEAWTYETGIYTGISVGVFDRISKNSKAVVSVESVDGIDRITINRVEAEKYGFRIVEEDETK